MFPIHLDSFPMFTEQETWALLFALAFILMDMIVGTVCAFGTGKWQSTKAREGIFHKVLECLVIVLAALIQPAVALVSGIDLPGVILLPVCAAIILMEVGSCIENIGNACPQLKESGIFKLFANKN